MVILPLVLALVIVGVVYAARHGPVRRLATGSGEVGAHHGPAISSVGQWSLIVLTGALLVWSLTFATVPIYYAAAIAGIAFVLAVVAVVRYTIVHHCC